MRIGITGHQKLEEPSNWNWVGTELGLVVSRHRPLTGISCLAAGADQLFASTVLQQGGALEVIVPFTEYDATFSETADRETYLDLLKRAWSVDVLPREGTDEEAFFVAGQAIVNRSELMIAVWDGKPAKGLGGTADIVAYALQHSTQVVHLNPVTRKRSLVGD